MPDLNSPLRKQFGELFLGLGVKAKRSKSLHPHQQKPKSNTNKKVFGLGFLFIQPNKVTAYAVKCALQ